MQSLHVCRNCNNSFEGKFCNACGEKAFSEHDKSVKHFIEEGFHFITHFDSKFLSTLKLVIFKTGFYSLEYSQGRKKKYFKPVSLFLIIIILYLLFPAFRGLNMNFDTYTNPAYKYAVIAVPAVKAKLSNALTITELEKRYNDTSPKFAKFLLLLLLPLTAFSLKGLFYKQKKYLYDHFLMATELNAFFVFVYFLVLPLVMYALAFFNSSIVKYFHDGSGLYLVLSGFFLLASIVAFKRFYKENWLWTIGKSIAFMFLFQWVIIFIYKMILFLLVMLFI